MFKEFHSTVKDDFMRTNSNQRVIYKLCIQNVPFGWNVEMLKNHLGRFGQMNDLHYSRASNCTYYFAECPTERDYQAILNGMKINNYGIKVVPKTSKRDSNELNRNGQLQNQQIAAKNNVDFSASNKISMANRRICHFNKEEHPRLSKIQENVYSTFRRKHRENFHNKKLNLCNEIINFMKEKSNKCQGIKNFENETYTKDFNVSQLPAIKIGKCCCCKKMAVNRCEGCDEFYCSVECQTNNWSNHRISCLKMPVLKEIKKEDIVVNDDDKSRSLQQIFFKESLSKNSSLINKPEIADTFKSGQQVLMTHVEHTNMVFVRSYEKDANDDYIKILSEIFKYSSKAKYLTKLPAVNEYVLAYYDGESDWYRAIVVDNSNSQKIQILYVDVGNWTFKKLNELKEFPNECFNLKRYVVPVYLKNVRKTIINPKIFYEYMDELVYSHAELKIVFQPNEYNDDKLLVDLFDLSGNEHVNKKCIELLEPKTPDIDEDPIWVDSIEEEYLPCGENVPVFIFDVSLGMITCISKYNVDELDQLNDEIKKYAEKENYVYTPCIDEMCIAKYNDQKNVWYRAFCVETVGDQHPCLFFLDYGSCFPVNINKIRKYPKELALPFWTTECELAGLENVKIEENLKLQERLKELLPLHIETVLAKVERKDEDGSKYIVHIPSVIEKLKNEGLLEI